MRSLSTRDKSNRPVFFCIDITYFISLSYQQKFIKLLSSKEHGKEIGCCKNVATLGTLSDKRFRSALATTFRACAVAKFEVDDDDRGRTSEFATKRTFPNALITYLTFQPSSNTWDKSRKTPEIFFFFLLMTTDSLSATEPPTRRGKERSTALVT